MAHPSSSNRKRLRYVTLSVLAFVLGAMLAAFTSSPAGSGTTLVDSASVLGATEEREPPAFTATTAPVPTTPTPTTLTPATPTPVSGSSSSSTTSTSTATSASTSTSSSTTSTSTSTTSTAAPAPKPLGQQAEELLNYPWRQKFPEWTLIWAEAKSGVRALTFPERKVIEMYVRPGDDPAFLARVLAHELGHVADIELNDDSDRARWREVRGIPDTVYWWPQGNSYDFDTVAGDFAEGFATLLMGSDTKSRVAGQPTAEQLAVMAELVR